MISINISIKVNDNRKNVVASGEELQGLPGPANSQKDQPKSCPVVQTTGIRKEDSSAIDLKIAVAQEQSSSPVQSNRDVAQREEDDLVQPVQQTIPDVLSIPQLYPDKNLSVADTPAVAPQQAARSVEPFTSTVHEQPSDEAPTTSASDELLVESPIADSPVQPPIEISMVADSVDPAATDSDEPSIDLPMADVTAHTPVQTGTTAVSAIVPKDLTATASEQPPLQIPMAVVPGPMEPSAQLPPTHRIDQTKNKLRSSWSNARKVSQIPRRTTVKAQQPSRIPKKRPFPQPKSSVLANTSDEDNQQGSRRTRRVMNNESRLPANLQPPAGKPSVRSGSVKESLRWHSPERSNPKFSSSSGESNL